MLRSGESLEQLLENYAASPVSTGRALGELLAHHRRQFFSASLEALKSGARSPGHAHLINLLIDNDLLPEALSSPDQFSLEEATEFFTLLSRIDPRLDTKLARWVLRRLSGQPGERPTAAAHRILSIFERTAASRRLGPILVQLLRFPDPAIRSKAVLLLGRSTQDARWALSDPDPRVRANAAEAMWDVDTKETRHALRALARDPNNRVVGNAWLALYKLGEPNAGDELSAMARHASPKFRATAAWVMGQTADRGFLDTLRQLEDDADDNVRRNARLAIARIEPGGAPDAAPPPAA